jgi:membrane protein implicated in regulation of membrane protease activity
MNRGRRQVAITGLAALFVTPASATPLVTAQPLDMHLGRLFLVLVLCIALAVAAAFLLKRVVQRRLKPSALGAPWLQRLGGSAVTVLESRRISAHADVCRLACGGREYLVVVSQGGATVLRDDVARPEAAP